MATTTRRPAASPGRKAPQRPSRRDPNAREGERGRKPGLHTDFGDNDKYEARGAKLVETRVRAKA
jgi:hypothetical protein